MKLLQLKPSKGIVSPPIGCLYCTFACIIIDYAYFYKMHVCFTLNDPPINYNNYIIVSIIA